MIPLSTTVSTAFDKPFAPTSVVEKAKLAVVLVVAPASKASEQPSLSESKSR